MPRYEHQLREWRAALKRSNGDMDMASDIRDEIIAFRRARRLDGWELRLGSLDIQVKGFRSDDAMSVGFRRMVLMLGESGDIRYVVGSANHIQLDSDLNARLRENPPSVPMESHYLWYRRMEGVLELAGADSQPQELMPLLIAYVDAHKSDMVRALYKLT